MQMEKWDSSFAMTLKNEGLERFKGKEVPHPLSVDINNKRHWSLSKSTKFMNSK